MAEFWELIGKNEKILEKFVQCDILTAMRVCKNPITYSLGGFLNNCEIGWFLLL